MKINITFIPRFIKPSNDNNNNNNKTININVTVTLLSITLLSSIFAGPYLTHNDGDENSVLRIENAPNDIADDKTFNDKNIVIENFTNSGFVFPNSNKEKITYKDIYSVNEAIKYSDYSFTQMMHYSINEIYARHGYVFKDEQYSNFYKQYSWYINTIKKDEIEWSEFNYIEQENIVFLKEIRDG